MEPEPKYSVMDTEHGPFLTAWPEDDGHVDAEILFNRLKTQDGIHRGAFRRVVRRMVRQGRARIYYVEGRACIRLTPEGKEWFDANR